MNVVQEHAGRKSQSSSITFSAQKKQLSGQTVYLIVLALVCSGVLGYWWWQLPGKKKSRQPVKELTLAEIPFDGAQAYEYLKELCALGPRPSGSEQMTQQQKLLIEHFEQLGAKVSRQEFQVRHPQNGLPVEMANIIIQWHPESKQRILLCAHYDTRPFPDLDPTDPKGVFLGANDGAGGTALLMELGRHMKDLKGSLGVDFVLFDGEELVFSENDKYFLGSEHFAQQYKQSPPKHRYRWGVLLDMVADKDLQIYQERHGMEWRDTRPLVQQIWGVARRLKVKEFIPQLGHQVRDDHLPLHEIAGISCCDVIDFDYPHWHTRDDTPENCSAESLAKVGWVIHEWLKSSAAGK